jgi:hypothetical protein
MIETELPGVKSLPLKTRGSRGSRGSGATPNAAASGASSVNRITNQRETKMLQVHSNLMRTTSL